MAGHEQSFGDLADREVRLQVGEQAQLGGRERRRPVAPAVPLDSCIRAKLVDLVDEDA